MKECVIGVDIGGTKIATGIVRKDGTLVGKVVIPTLAERGLEVSLGQVYKSIQDICETDNIGENDIKGIGVCAPGPLDPFNGIIHNPPNLPGWREIPLVKLIMEKFNKETKLENDANAAGMAEVMWGAAKGYKHVFYVTVSTGIGTAVIIDGKIFHGKNGMAGEGGHITISYKEKKAVCTCGNIGCIETLASGPNTVKRLLNKIKNDPGIKTILRDITAGDVNKLTMVDIGKAASSGDSLALETIREQGKLLGIWLAGMISILDPEIIVVGGGVSLLGDVLFSEIRKHIPPHTINEFAELTPVVPAELKTDAGIFGAAAIIGE